MAQEFWYDSAGAGRLHGCLWRPEGAPRAIVQIVHGIADHIERYDDFARYLNRQGFLVVGQSHMGHGQSVSGGSIQGYFHGGWFTAVEDILTLSRNIRAQYPELPWFLFGHSMGSFLTRTILCKYPQLPLAGSVICGTAWQPSRAMPVIVRAMEAVCRLEDETQPSEKLQNMVFGSYNAKVEHPRTAFDWISRDKHQVDAYIADPMCGFTVTAGLLRDMMIGIDYIQRQEHLANMEKSLPVFFIAGGDDPVGNYGKGVGKAAEKFRSCGMADIALRIYPLCRHEILNEINKEEIYEDVAQWLVQKLPAD